MFVIFQEGLDPLPPPSGSAHEPLPSANRADVSILFCHFLQLLCFLFETERNKGSINSLYAG